MRATPFAARLAATIVAIVLAAGALTVALSYLNFRSVLHEQENTVYGFAAAELRDEIQDSLNLGLPLRLLQNTETLLTRSRTAEPGVVSISVFDSAGLIVFDTSRLRAGNVVPEAWLPPRPDLAEWSGADGDAFLVGARLIDDFNLPAGGIVVRYATRELQAHADAMLLHMVDTAIVLLLAIGPLGLLATLLLTRAQGGWFAVRGVSCAPLACTSGGTARAGFTTAFSEVGAALDAAERDLMRLGMGERHAA